MYEVITITFNPCIDKSTTVEALISEIKLRCSAPKYEAGGGGINVARAIRKLGGEAMAIYPSGDYSGKFLNFLLEIEGVPKIYIDVPSHTRENFMVFDETTGKQYRFGMPGSWISADDYRKCIEQVEEMRSVKYFVASGSLPPGVPNDSFATLAKIAKSKGAKLVVDTTGVPLQLAIQEGIYFAKPNLKELALLCGKELHTIDEISQAALEILIANERTEALIVSMGARGALLVTRSETLSFTCPVMQVKSTVGAGDSMVAGIVQSLCWGNSLQEAMKYGVACGSSATLKQGTELCDGRSADDLVLRIAATKIR